MLARCARAMRTISVTCAQHLRNKSDLMAGCLFSLTESEDNGKGKWLREPR